MDARAFEVRQLAVGPIRTNCYILSLPERGDCAVIDPGGSPERILGACEGKRIAAILLTHGHFDHIGAVDALAGGGAEVMIHALDAPMLTDPDLNASWLISRPCTVQAAPRLLQDGDTVEAAGIRFRVIHTPGHTPGGVCFEAGDCLFTGDTVMAGGVGRTDLPGGDESALYASLRALNPLLRTHEVYGGHG